MNPIEQSKPIGTVGKTYAGNELWSYPAETLFVYGVQVGAALKKHQKTMLQYTPEQIVDIIHEGRVIVAVNEKNQGHCMAFAQISPWKDADGKPVAIEFRSWISWAPEAGVHVLHGAIELSKKMYPGIPLYAVVEASNLKAQQKLLGFGSVLYDGMPQGMKIELGKGEAQVHVFSLPIQKGTV